MADNKATEKAPLPGDSEKDVRTSFGPRFKKAYEKYLALAESSAGEKPGSAARKAKCAAHLDALAIEREANKAGVKLLVVPGAEHNTVEVTEKGNSTKRSLQEEYVRKFDNEQPVKIGDGDEQTLREFHEERLGVKG